MVIVNDPDKADFSIHEVFDADEKISFPIYLVDLDTIDCWCFSAHSVMYQKDLKNYKSGEFV